MIRWPHSPAPCWRGLRTERGQTLVLVAVGFIGLLGFVGLAVDAGIVYTYFAHLRKGVDLAALSASNQFKRGASEAMLRDSAKEFILLNLPGTDPDAEVQVTTCYSATPPPFCSQGGEMRKRVRVEAETKVPLAFLPILGVGEVTIHSDAEAEAASLDVILVVDNSPSMAYDGATPSPGCNPHDCHPFEEVKQSATVLADGMFYPYDRLGLVTFSRFAVREYALTICDPAAGNCQQAISNLEVDAPLTSCPYPGTPVGCTTTNVSAALAQAHKMLRDQGRDDAVWVVILLSDGVTNAAHELTAEGFVPEPYPPDPSAIGWYCPTSTQANPPLCQDGDGTVTHTPDQADVFDADDMARWVGTLVGCRHDSTLTGCPSGGGDGAVIFTIGLGDSVTSYHPNPAAPYPPTPDVGEMLLRFIANVGFDGNPDGGSPDADLCYGRPNQQQCGNYYFAQDVSALDPVFDAIAERIFTRLTK